MGKVDIGFVDGSVVFTTAGAKTRCVAIEANWPGYATLDKALLLSFLTAKPTKPHVEIQYENGKLKIERVSVAALWAETPEWITEMSSEARFFEGPEDRYAEIRNCGTRSVCKNLWADLTETPDPKIRHCGACHGEVHLCLNAKELQNAIAADKRVAIEIRKRKAGRR
ncbi:MAG: hypothetical protein FGM18_09560 [Burkholderiaceae bacterium]|nr:hypothetical protein [Burkholderiaceae bacterium]